MVTWACRGSYLISFIGIVDLISLHAFIGTSFFLATRDDAMHPKYISEGAATRACRSRMGPTWPCRFPGWLTGVGAPTPSHAAPDVGVAWRV